MTVYSEILGNLNREPDWQKKVEGFDIEYVPLDQWTAQKSRFLGKGTKGNEYPVALARGSRVTDGDILAYDPENKTAAVVKLDLNPVLVVNMEALANADPLTTIRHSVEFGHAIGNQHWPAVVKGTKIYIPLTVDKKVMLSVLETHHIEGITYDFQDGTEVIPYLAPHEIRRLFGGASQESHSHEHGHDSAAWQGHCHDHDHEHEQHHHHHHHDDKECCGHDHSDDHDKAHHKEECDKEHSHEHEHHHHHSKE